MRNGQTIHASCVVVGEAGVLIRGEAGAGKSTLARDLIHTTSQAGLFVCLVSDDRTRLTASHGRVIAEAVAPIAGRLEVRGVGIIAVPHEPSAVVRLVVDLSAKEPPRLPEPQDLAVLICSITLPRLQLPRGASSGTSLGASLAGLVLGRLNSVHNRLMTI
jgi:HPr kinase/phosphorylase